MVAQLDERSMQIVVQGVGGRSCGLGGCYLAPRPSSYDHTRRKKLKDAGRPLLDVRLPVWGSVIKRQGGAGLRLHPQRSTVKVETFKREGAVDPVAPTPQGCGGSSGCGAYKCYKSVQAKEILRFDSAKGKLLSPFYRQ